MPSRSRTVGGARRRRYLPLDPLNPGAALPKPAIPCDSPRARPVASNFPTTSSTSWKHPPKGT